MIATLAAFPPAELAAFVAAGIVLNLTPGADVIFATASGMAGGPRAGALAGLGVGLGSLWHIALAALGVSALLAAHPAALSALTFAGAAYLLWLAVQSWRAGAAPPARGERAPLAALRRGFVTNALNPKVALFVLAFLPQFTDPARGPVWQQIVILGAIFTLTGTAITSGYGALAGWAGARLAHRMGRMNKLAALLYAGLAAKLVWD